MCARWLPCLATLILPLLAGTAVACGASQPPTAPEAPQSTDAIPITGSERLGWMQRASDLAEASSLTYAAYVDGARVSLTAISCEPASAGGFRCSAPFPAMTPGRHTIEVTAATALGRESERSQPMIVLVAASQRPPAGG